MKITEDDIRKEVEEINKDLPEGLYQMEIYPGVYTWVGRQTMIEIEIALRLKVIENRV